MTPVQLFVIAVSLWAASLVLTWGVCQIATARSILDVPNERSSHRTPTPRGAGIAIAAVTLLALAWFTSIGVLSRAVGLGLIGGGTAVALVGWLDDTRGVTPLKRAIVHCCAAIWAVAWIGDLPNTIAGGHLAVSVISSILAVLGITWAVNFYNFMDGIDGIAGGEGVVVAGASATLLWHSGLEGLAIAEVAMGAACLGFLFWNWPPAKIFMGDVGSGFLGFLFSSLIFAGRSSGRISWTVLALPLGLFIADATLTLVRRMLAGERWSNAHRRHAYQRAVQAGYSHSGVASAVMAGTVLLGVCAWVAMRDPEMCAVAVVVGTAIALALYGAVERVAPMYTNNGASRRGMDV